jgi:hypothetical protein
MQNSNKNSVPAKRRGGYLSFRKLLFHLSRKRTVLGFQVAVFLPGKEEQERVFAKNTDALEMISKYAPHRVSRMRRELKRIWVFSNPPYQAT